MSIYQIFGLALCVVVACMLPGVKHTEYAIAMRIGFGVMVFGFCFTLISPYFGLIESFAKHGAMAEYFPVLLRAVGIAFFAEIAASVCRDAGEESVAKNVEFIAKAEILILSFPLIKKLFETTEALLAGI